MQATKRKTGMVRVLGGFSEINNIQSYNSALQFDDFDDSSRVQISNELYRILELYLQDILISRGSLRRLAAVIKEYMI